MQEIFFISDFAFRVWSWPLLASSAINSNLKANQSCFGAKEAEAHVCVCFY